MYRKRPTCNVKSQTSGVSPVTKSTQIYANFHTISATAFEMWLWRRMEKISWVDMVSNDEVLQRVQGNRSILDTVQQHKLRWIEHILRHDSLLRDIVEGRMLGRATRGRKHLQMLSKSQAKTTSLWREMQKTEEFVMNLLDGRRPERNEAETHRQIYRQWWQMCTKLSAISINKYDRLINTANWDGVWRNYSET